MSPSHKARKPPLTHVALFFIAILSITTGTLAQSTYKCGNTYSATPCTGGAAIDTADTRTSQQRAQSEAATSKAAKAGEAMEKSRLTQERAHAKAQADSVGAGATVISAQNPGQDASEPISKAEAKKKKNAPEYFTAQVTGEKKAKAKKVKKTAEKAQSKKTSAANQDVASKP